MPTDPTPPPVPTEALEAAYDAAVTRVSEMDGWDYDDQARAAVNAALPHLVAAGRTAVWRQLADDDADRLAIYPHALTEAEAEEIKARWLAWRQGPAVIGRDQQRKALADVRTLRHRLTVEEAADQVRDGRAAVAFTHRLTEAVPQLGRVRADDAGGRGVPVEGSVFGHELSIGGGLPPRLVSDTVVDIHQQEEVMAQYTRPVTRRSYAAIQADIEATVDAWLPSTAHGSGPRFWQAQAEACERLRDLWNEIVWQATEDKKLPEWAGFAAITTRDDFARRAREAHLALESS